LGGGPGVLGELGAGEGFGGFLGGAADDFQRDAFVFVGEGFEQFRGTEEEAGGGAEAVSVDAVRGFAVLVLQVDVGAGELDEGFVVSVESAVRAEPDVLQNVVGGVIFLRVEEAEILHVAGVPAAAGESGNLRGDLFVFAHGARERKHRRGRAHRGKTARAGLMARND